MREKLGGARVEPPSDMWARIAATLDENGLTAAAPATAPSINIRRPRRLRLGYAAAAAVLVCAIVFSLRWFGPGDAPLTAQGDSENMQILTPEQITAIIDANTPEDETPAEPTLQQRIRGAAQRGMGLDAQGPATRTVLAAAAETDPVAEPETTTVAVPAAEKTTTEGAATEERTTKEASTDADQAKQQTQAESKTAAAEDNTKTRARKTSDEGRVPVDRPYPIAEDRRAGRRAAPFGVSVFSNNVGGLSKEKVVTNSSAPRASDFTIYEATSSGHTLGSARGKELKYHLRHKMPISGGISVGVGLSDRLSVESGVTYTYMFSEGESESTGTGAYDIERRLHYIGIPIGVSYDFLQSRVIDLYGSAAAQFEMCVSGKQTKTMREGGMSGKPDTEKLNIKGVQPSVGVHLGAEVKLSRTFGLYVEPGLNYYFENSKQPESYRTEHPLNFSLRAGLRINLGSK